MRNCDVCNAFQANLYWSPPGLKTSVGPHQDAQSVFVIQLSGHKTWKIFKPLDRIKRVPNGRLAIKKTHRGKGDDLLTLEDVGGDSNVEVETRLSPGDVLFIPRAAFHVTSTYGEIENSLHVTIGVETETDGQIWGSVLADAIAAIVSDAPVWREEFRRALPQQLVRQPLDPSAAYLAIPKLRKLLKYLEDTSDGTWTKALGDVLKNRHNYMQAKWEQQRRFLQNFEERTTLTNTQHDEL